MGDRKQVARLWPMGVVIVVAAISYPYGSSFNSIVLPVDPRAARGTVPESGEVPVFAEWIALGSGCHAKSNEAGDVSMERIANTGAKNDVYVVRFHLDQYQLTSAGRPPNEPLNFAKECAIRVQVLPPPGKRIRSLYANTSVVSVKSAGTKLTLAGTLKIGAQTLGQKIVIRQAGTASAAEEAFVLFPGAEPDEVFPALSCEENKLAGFDFTWIAERHDNTDAIFVEVAADKVLDMVAELEDCN